MASFTPVVLKRKANGEWKVYVRITHRRRSSYAETGLTATDSDVRRGKLVGSFVLDRANEIVREMRRRVNDYGPAVLDMDVEGVRAVAERVDTFDRDFMSFCRRHVEELERDGRTGTAKVHGGAVSSLSRYMGRPSLYYDDMTPEFLRGYREHLRETVGANTAVRYMSTLGTIFRKAKEELNSGGEERVKGDPFRYVKAGRIGQTRKKALTLEDIILIRDADFLTPMVERSRDLFMLSFYLVGMNAADIYELEKPEDGHVVYRRRKTRGRRKDEALMRLAVPDEVWPIMEKYADRYGERAFDFYNQYKDVYRFSGSVGHCIKILGEAVGIPDLTFYAARHSWATIAANVCGVDIYTVEKALCHSPSGLAMTEIYIKPDFTKVDNANRLVLDALEEAAL